VQLKKHLHVTRVSQRWKFDSLSHEFDALRKIITKLNSADDHDRTVVFVSVVESYEGGYSADLQRTRDGQHGLQEQTHRTQAAVQALLKVAEEGTREGLERIAIRVRQIGSAIDATKAAHTTEYARDTAVLQERLQTRIRVLHAAVAVQKETNEMNNREERDEMCALQNKLNAQGDTCISELRAEYERVQKEIDEYTLVVKAREVQCVRELNAAFEQRGKAKHTKIGEFNRKYEAELTTRTATVPTSDLPHEKQSHAEEMN
jgi:hypothetical protein